MTCQTFPSHGSLRLAALCLVLLTSMASHADRIHLTNGHALEGIVIKETKEAVVLDIGLGNTTVSRSRIRTIERSNDADRDTIRNDWSRQYFSHKKYAPDRFKELATSFRQLGDMRAMAKKSKVALDQHKHRAEALRNKLIVTERAFVDINRALHDTTDLPRKTREEVDAYNRMISSNNLLSAELKATVNDMSETDNAIRRSFGSMHDFSDSLARFHEQHAEARRLRVLNPEEQAFLADMGRKLEGYESEFVRHEIPHRRSGGALLVDVKLNRVATGTFLLDTGASVMTLSPAMAARLRLKSEGPQVEMVIADGTRVSAKPVILKSVAVGDAHASNVGAVIMPDAPGEGLDGLLGMTFLREFEMRIDPASGKVALRELR
ncbi:MAG: retropepsin-like aspartic protease [Verrucomicrobia bacterium]|nr:retropepsin-like aspartic protease [Verrucomicrobiota bacterium]MDA1087079.1 retropepsin-like aspartic protease [Verrucomicrobiota bacterium]